MDRGFPLAGWLHTCVYDQALSPSREACRDPASQPGPGPAWCTILDTQSLRHCWKRVWFAGQAAQCWTHPAATLCSSIVGSVSSTSSGLSLTILSVCNMIVRTRPQQFLLYLFLFLTRIQFSANTDFLSRSSDSRTRSHFHFLLRRVNNFISCMAS